MAPISTLKQRVARYVGLLHIVVAHPLQCGRGWDGAPFKNARFLDTSDLWGRSYGPG